MTGEPIDAPRLGAHDLAGPQKVAALLLAMGKPLASRMLRHFDEAEIKLIARSASSLGSIAKATVNALIDEFVEKIAAGDELEGSTKIAEQLLSGIVPTEQVAAIMSDLNGAPEPPVWPRLDALADTGLSQYLAKEHPQVAAFVLARCAPGSAAAALALLSNTLRNELTNRMLAIKPVTDGPQKLLERCLRDELLENAGNKSGPVIHARLANIINKMERQHMDEVVQNLDLTRPKDAEVIKGLLFTFDDIVRITQAARIKLFDQVPADRTILALKGADAGLTGLILSSVASRARRMIEQEVASGAPVPMKDILKARRSIADLALSLAERGEIELAAEAPPPAGAG